MASNSPSIVIDPEVGVIFTSEHQQTDQTQSAAKKGIRLATTAILLVLGVIASTSFSNGSLKKSSTLVIEEESDRDKPTPSSARRTAAKSMSFNPSLKIFGVHVLNGYNSCRNLEADVKNALKLLADTTIKVEKANDCTFRYYPMYSMASSAGDSSAAPQGKASASGGETSYGTNNQVDGVDEADITKSDGTYIFVGYGDEIIVTDLQGNSVVNVTLPPPPNATIDTSADNGGLFKYQMPYYGQRPPEKRTVLSLLLHKNIVTVIATYFSWQCESALCGGVTNAFLYKFDPASKALTLMTQIDINGAYSTARSIGSFTHIATTASVDTWSFAHAFSRCNPEFTNMTAKQYEAAAYKTANVTVAKHAKQIIKGLAWIQSTSKGAATNKNACKHVVQISSLTNQNSKITSQRGLSLYNGQSILQNFIQLTSFDMAQGELAGTYYTASGAFTNAYGPQMYATEDRLVLANNGYYYQASADGTSSTYSEYTYLMTFDLTGAVATPISVGQVPGYLNNQYSMDYFNGTFRIATTNSQKWNTVFNKKSGSYSSELVSESSSQVYVLQEQFSQLLVTGSVKDLGKGETIQAVRFFGDKGYVVTFRQTDPLYVIDFSTGTPKVASELKVTGFSEFMYPIKDGTFLLTVGNEADVNGLLTGMKISVFDVSDPYAPSEAGKFVVPYSNGWASSEALWDPHAFRYLNASEKLIIPLSIYNWEQPENNFDGFAVYDIDVINGIKLAGNITHADSNSMVSYCWGDSFLSPRNMVFDGNLVTLKTHSIVSTSLSTWEQNWEVNLDEGRDKLESFCNGYLY